MPSHPARPRQRGQGVLVPQPPAQTHTIAEPKDQRANRRRRGIRGGRPVGFDKELYKRRNEVERTINRLNPSVPRPTATTNAPASSMAPSPSQPSVSGSAGQALKARRVEALVT
ncbi:hypothetical protein GCM10010510_19350 [Streptomyces anandii JCM 4720]|nr:hypothetical protein GCM10010510_19350 [Streptomyces anandii JCM 4720]